MRILKFILLVAICADAYAQFGGYQSLHAPFGARNAALGGRAVSLADGDLLQFTHNPATLDSVPATEAGINMSPYFAGIFAFDAAFKADLPKVGGIGIAIKYLNYGEFIERADNGERLGVFSAQDYVVVLGKSHRISSFTLGLNLKYAYSGVAGYGSSLLVGDLGGIYRAPGGDFTAGIVFKNFGFVVGDYMGHTNRVPFDLQIGMSVKPKHMPFRFTLSGHSLVVKDLYVADSTDISISRTVKLADQVFRRINIGTELIIHKNVQLLFGYNHLKRQELGLEGRAYGAGFSYGFSILIKKVRFQYAHDIYHAAGGTDFFTIQANLNSFRKVL